MKNLSINTKKSLSWAIIVTSLALSACGSSSNSSVGNKTYKVTLTNTTANQPLSPAAIILHKSSYQVFQAGQAASVEFEKLAEGGSNQAVLDDAKVDNGVITSQSGLGAIPPGGAETIELSIAEDGDSVYISVAAMLVNTNDAFVGASSNKISSLKKGESYRMHVPIWDAGTEANSESEGTIPGPADGGEGFNASRGGDSDFVAIHQGVVTHADGLATSVLGESHRFDNPGALLSVERLQ